MRGKSQCFVYQVKWPRITEIITSLSQLISMGQIISLKNDNNNSMYIRSARTNFIQNICMKLIIINWDENHSWKTY